MISTDRMKAAVDASYNNEVGVLFANLFTNLINELKYRPPGDSVEKFKAGMSLLNKAHDQAFEAINSF